MFGLKRWRYRDHVATQMSYLINLNEPYRERLMASFDGINGVIDDMGTKGRPAIEAAAEIWAIIFSYEIERSPQMLAEASRIEGYVFDNEGSSRFDTEDVMKTFIFNAEKQRIMGKLSDQQVDYASTEILGALRGMSREERHDRRMSAILDGSVVY